jgi:hypothetical protein
MRAFNGVPLILFQKTKEMAAGPFKQAPKNP